MHTYYIKKIKERIITVTRNCSDHKKIQKNWNSEMKMENNCMDISSDKMAKYHLRLPKQTKEKGNLKIETEYFLIAAKNNAISTNYVDEKTNDTLQNDKYR